MVKPPQNWIADEGCFYGVEPSQEPSLGDSPNATNMAVSPLLSIAPDIYTLDPAWKKARCNYNIYTFAFNDPPRVLTPVAALTPPTAGQVSTNFLGSPAPSSSPVPAAVPSTPPLKTPSPGSTQSTPNILPSSVAETPATPGIIPLEISTTQDSRASVRGSTLSSGQTSKDPASNDPASNHPVSKDPASNHPASNGPTSKDPASNGAPSPTSKPHVIVTMGNTPVYAVPNGGISVDGTVANAGDPALTINDTPISVDSQAVHVGDSAYPNSQAATATLRHDSPPNDGVQSMKAGPNGAIVIDSSTISPEQHTTIGGSSVAVQSDHVVVNGITYSMPSLSNVAETSNNGPQLTVDGKTIRSGSDGAIVLGGSTIPPNQHTTVHGVYISVGSDKIMIGSQTYDRNPEKPSAEASAYSALGALIGGSQASTLEKGGVVIAGSTVLSGQQTTINGVYVSLGSGSIIVGTSTYDIPTATPTNDESASSALAALISSTPFSIASSGAVILGGKTLPLGTQTSISGSRISVGSHEVIIGSVTYPISSNVPQLSTASNGAIVLGHETLSTGEIKTISGDIVSLGTSVVVIKGTTYPLPQLTDSANPAPISDDSLGVIIASMFGYVPSSVSSDPPLITGAPTAASLGSLSSNSSSLIPNLASFTGAQSRSAINKGLLYVTAVLCICLYTADLTLR